MRVIDIPDITIPPIGNAPGGIVFDGVTAMGIVLGHDEVAADIVAFPFQYWAQGFPLYVFGDWNPDKVENGRHQVNVANQRVRNEVLFYPRAGEAQRHVHSPVVGRRLGAVVTEA